MPNGDARVPFRRPNMIVQTAAVIFDKHVEDVTYAERRAVMVLLYYHRYATPTQNIGLWWDSLPEETL